MSKARELAELSRTVSDSADATAITIDSSEDVILSQDLRILDSKGARFGTDEDFTIYNDGSNTYLRNSTVNQDILFLGNDDGSANLQMLKLDASNAGRAFFSAGASFNGNINANDNQKFIVGSHDDAAFYHDGNHTLLEETGNGALKLKGDDIRLENSSGNNIIKAVGNSAELYENGSKKLETTSSGIDVTGSVLVSNGSVSAPTYSFSNDTDTGVFLNSVGYLGLAVAGSKQLELGGGIIYTAANGKIRSDNNGGSLELSGGGATVGGQILLRGGTGDADIVFKAQANTTTPAERMRIRSDGKVDIKLNTNAYGTFADNIGEVGSGNFCLQVANSAGNALKPLGFRAEEIKFATGSATRGYFNSSGHLVLGSSSHADDVLYLVRSNAGKIQRFYVGSEAFMKVRPKHQWRYRCVSKHRAGLDRCG